MGFGDLSKDSGLKALDEYLLTRSYIEGYKASQADAVIYNAIGGKKPNDKYVNALRWYIHMKSFGEASIKNLPGSAKSADKYGLDTNGSAVAGPKDDFDLFGSDEDDEADRAEILAKYNEKKSKKPQVIAKSTILLDVKPLEDKTDMVKLEAKVRKIEKDGLLWGQSKLIPVAYGIKKLQIGCVVEDDKVGTDFLEETIMEFEDMVQSVDIVSFQKI